MRQARQSNRHQRRRAQRRGRLAEWFCLWHLQLRGWRILARDWRCPSGEIDILARRGSVLAIIEVKSRQEIEAADLGAEHAAEAAKRRGPRPPPRSPAR